MWTKLARRSEPQARDAAAAKDYDVSVRWSVRFSD